ANILIGLGIPFETQKTFDGLRDNKPLRFDFYFKYRRVTFFGKQKIIQYVIEFDGLQHQKPVKFFGGTDKFKDIQRRDKMKDLYCKKEGIHLLRVSTLDHDKLRVQIIKFILNSGAKL